MRTPKEIADIIGEDPLVTVTPATTRVWNSPEEIRKEADRDRIDDREFIVCAFVDGKPVETKNPNFGKVIEKLHSSGFRKYLLDMADKGESVTLTTPEKVEVNFENVCKLERRIRATLTIGEILSFADRLHDGDFISSSGKWRRSHAGYVALTHQEDATLTRLWNALIRTAFCYIGAATLLKMHNSTFVRKGQGGKLICPDCNANESLYNMTIDDIARDIPKEYLQQLDLVSRQNKILETLHGGVNVKHFEGEAKSDIENIESKIKVANKEHGTALGGRDKKIDELKNELADEKAKSAFLQNRIEGKA